MRKLINDKKSLFNSDIIIINNIINDIKAIIEKGCLEKMMKGRGSNIKAKIDSQAKIEH